MPSVRLRKLASTRPVRQPQLDGRGATGQCQDPSPNRWRDLFPWSPARPIVQRGDTAESVAVNPEVHRWAGHSREHRDIFLHPTFGRPQHDPSSCCDPCRHVVSIGQSAQLGWVWLPWSDTRGQLNRSCVGRGRVWWRAWFVRVRRVAEGYRRAPGRSTGLRVHAILNKKPVMASSPACACVIARSTSRRVPTPTTATLGRGGLGRSGSIWSRWWTGWTGRRRWVPGTVSWRPGCRSTRGSSTGCCCRAIWRSGPGWRRAAAM